MDGTRFDNLTRSLAGATSRRAMLRGLAGVLAGGLAGSRLTDVAAQRPARQANGAPCTRATECASFHCVDGVCCDIACTGQCEACDLPGVEGTCSPVVGTPVGKRAACPGSGPCRATCDGINRKTCAGWPGSEVACGATACADGWLTTSACGGNGSCVPITTSCAPFGCAPSGAACATGCQSDGECGPGSACVNGGCVAAQPLGAACTDHGQCVSGHCASGVCCAEACNGPCQVCGPDGFCGATADDRPCADGLCCEGACVAVATDVEHCGRCHNTCLGEVCQQAICTGGVCNTVPLPDGSPCDDGDPCTNPDTCQGGVCTGPSVTCPDPDQCHEPGVCATATGDCVYPTKPDGAGCTDQNACTDPDTCQDGVCRGVPINCDDGLACTVDSCDPATGCVHTPQPGFCLIVRRCYAAGDRNPATPCQVCDPAQDTDDWTNLDQGAPCDDTMLCNGREACDGQGACQPGIPVSCPPPQACQRAGFCNPDTGACVYLPQRPGTVCRAATTPCEFDALCNGVDPGCPANVPKPNDIPCDDGDLCVSSTCQDGICVARETVNCESSISCNRLLGCDPATGRCRYEPADEGVACGGPAPACHVRVCRAGDCVLEPISGSCVIAGACYAKGDRNPANHCQVCDPTLDTADWSQAADTCVIDGACYAAGEASPNGLCTVCDPAVSQTTWTWRPDDAPCSSPCLSDGQCRSGECVGEIAEGFCAIGASCYAGLEQNPLDPCQLCVAAISQTDWSPPPEGEVCKIDGVCYRPLDVHPDTPCLMCLPPHLADAWSPAFNGTPCGPACFTDGQCSGGKCISTVASETCAIDGVCYAAGDRRPGDACRVCDPARDQSAWSSADAGTFCVIDGVCYALGDRNPAVPCQRCNSFRESFAWSLDPGRCLIAGACYETGDRNPLNPCQMCDPTRDADDWWISPVGTYCVIGPTCYAEGAVNPTLPCLICDPERSDDSWSPATGTCQIAGACYAAGDHNPADPCLVCDPVRDQSAWSAIADTCFIDGACHAAGEAHPTDPCLVCNPTNVQHTWSAVANGTACGSACLDNGRCSFGVCRGEVAAGFCSIGGVCVETGATPFPEAPCLVCDPAQDRFAESRLPDGAPCATACVVGGTCQSGICSGGTPAPDVCIIGNACFARGELNPALAAPCEVCDPTVNQTAWTRLPDGTPCGDQANLCLVNPTCQAGICQPEMETACPLVADLPLCQEVVCDPAIGACVQVGIHLREDRQRCEFCPRCENGACATAPIPLSCGMCHACDPRTGMCVPAPAGTDCGSTCDTRCACDASGICTCGATVPGLACVDIGDECAATECDPETLACAETGANDGKRCGIDPCHECRGGQCVQKACGDCQECDPATGQCVACESCCRGMCGFVSCSGLCCGGGGICKEVMGFEACSWSNCVTDPTLDPCGDSCCPRNYKCCGDVCCPSDHSCCGDVCCGKGRKCCGPEYSNACCPVDSTCCISFTGAPICCPAHQACTPLGCR